MTMFASCCMPFFLARLHSQWGLSGKHHQLVVAISVEIHISACNWCQPLFRWVSCHLMHLCVCVLYVLWIFAFAAWLSNLWLADFPWFMPDLWLTCDHFVSKVSAICQPTKPTQPSIPSGVGKWVVIHVITDQGCVRLFDCRLTSVGAGLAYGL